MNDLTRLTPTHRAELRAAVGAGAVLEDDAARERYGRDETEDLVFPPAAAVLPASTAEVAAVLALAHRERLPVTPRGAGTGLSGGALPVRGGILLSLERMNRIRDLDPADRLAEVEAGVSTATLQRAADDVGLFYPPDPASRESCTLGGNLAEDSAGPRSLEYGSTRRWVLGLEAVTAAGRVLRTGGRNRKDVAGYDLTQLLVGSEGTLAVITAATLRLIPRPRHRLTALLSFSGLEPAAATIAALIRAGHRPAACELIDEVALGAVARTMTLPPAMAGQRALVCLELDGDDMEELFARAGAIEALAHAAGGGETIVAVDAADARRLWRVRERVGSAVKEGSIYKEADTVVPPSRLVELVRAARDVARRHGLVAACYGHAGDGNLHVNLLRGELADAEWQKRRDAAEEELFRAVVALGGSITGEHGVGWTQRRYLPLAVDPEALALMRAIKTAFDPRGILNPGKIFPDDLDR